MEKSSNNIKSECHKFIPLGLVLLDNIPTLGMYVLGTFLIWYISVFAAIFYVLYSLASIIWFWAKICSACHLYDTLCCPCGYGKISAFLFKQKNVENFRRVFRSNIIVLFPSWFLPPIAGTYALIESFKVGSLIVLIIFCLVAFVLIPVISKKVGCKNCQVKQDCPWMTKA